jgi:hypothetical protein
MKPWECIVSAVLFVSGIVDFLTSAPVFRLTLPSFQQSDRARFEKAAKCHINSKELIGKEGDVEKLMTHLKCLYSSQGYVVAKLDRCCGMGLYRSGKKRKFLNLGGGLLPSDMELAIRLSQKLQPQRIFGVGNSFGLSTCSLATVFPHASIDVIDAEAEGWHNSHGSNLTRTIARENGLDVSLTTGLSPKDTKKALRGQSYDLAFIDGLHTPTQMYLDWQGIRPYLSESAVTIFHDVDLARLHSAVQKVLHKSPGSRYLRYNSSYHDNKFGTGLLVRSADFDSYRDLGTEVQLVHKM